MTDVIGSPTNVRLRPPQRPLTIEDLVAFPDQLPTGPVKYELDNGRLVILPPADADHGSTHVRIISELFLQGELLAHGRTFCGTGVVLRRNLDALYCPDVAFVSNDLLPLQLSREGYLETMPDIVAEVRSKNDTTPEVVTKVGNYHQAGVRLVWVLDPEKRTVTVYPNGGPSQTLDATATLTADPIIPGLQVLVGSLFG
jgi:Uma2 family endonuclease